jgi:lipopolysaccharide transport system permease protein
MAPYKDMVIELFRKELRVRYKQLALGYVWSLASPLTYALLYYVVFKMIFLVKTENYPLFLIAGLFPWQWLSNSIQVGPMTFMGNAQLIKKTLFPRFLIPFVVVLQDGFHFLVSLPIIFIFMAVFDVPFSMNWIWALPILVVSQFLMAYSLNLFIASTNLFFRDLERIVQLIMTFLFYLTPVLYSEEMIPPEFREYIYWHPLAPLMLNWRSLVMTGTIDLTYVACSLGWGIFLLAVAQVTYSRLQWRFAEVL